LDLENNTRDLREENLSFHTKVQSNEIELSQVFHIVVHANFLLILQAKLDKENLTYELESTKHALSIARISEDLLTVQINTILFEKNELLEKMDSLESGM
jgi:hypothetical protein